MKNPKGRIPQKHSKKTSYLIKSGKSEKHDIK